MVVKVVTPKQAIRREHIYASAARLIADRGFKPMTMRDLAEEAGVSTGMVNHYFTNKSQIMTGTLRYVSTKMQARIEEAISDVPAGRGRLEALLKAALPHDDFSTLNWRVWIHAFAEASRSDEMKKVIAERYVSWHRTLSDVLAGAGATPRAGAVAQHIQVDALLNGLVIHHEIVGADLSTDDICATLLDFIDRN